MADLPVATAFVEVRPDLKGFETLLRTGVSAAIKKVAAPVKVIPNMTGFQAAVRTQAKASAAGTTVPVKVIPNLVGFQAALKAGVGGAATTVPVTVVPNLGGFAAALKAEVASVGSTTPIPVAVIPNMAGFDAELRAAVKTASALETVAVRVVPNLAGFQTALQAGVTATTTSPVKVLVAPNLTGFKTALAAEVAAAGTTKPIAVPVVPSLTGFKAAVVAEGEAIPPVTVPVIPRLAAPNLTGFVAKLKQEVSLLTTAPLKVRVAPNLIDFNVKLRSGVRPVQVAVVPKSLKALRVKVIPDLAGFRAAVRAGLANQILAPAVIPVVPDTTAFQVLLREEVATQTRQPVSILVIPDLAGFEATVRGVTSKIVKPIPVPVIPKLTGFQTALRTETKTIAATATVPVKVIPNLKGFAQVLRAGVRSLVLLPGTFVAVPVIPDLKGFAPTLKAKVKALGAVATTVPVPVTPVLGGFGAGAQSAVLPIQAVTSATNVATASQRSLGVQAAKTTATLKQQGVVASTLKGLNIGVGATSSGPAAVAATRANKGLNNTLKEQQKIVTANAIQTERFARGIAATGLSMFGLRGATLAATSAFLLGAAAVTAFSKAVGAATGFQRQLSVFAVTAGATSAQLERVRAVAIELGKDITLPGVSASDAAEAMTELAKAGLSVEDAIAGARGVLQLGTAANISFAEATTLAANAINAFGLSGKEATHVADVLANAANAAQGSIVDIGTAFGQAAAVGHQVGLTFEDTTVFLTSLAKAGLTSSDAGTSLRTALIRLINPSKKAQEIFKSLGVQLRDASGNLRPEFFVELGNAIAGMSKQQRDATLAQIGGQDAVRALAILTKQSINSLIAQRKELQKQGTAAEVAAARNTGLAGAGANLKNTIETLSISLGSKATPSLTSFTNALTGAVQATANSPLVTGTLAEVASATGDALRELGGVIASLASLLGPLAAAFNAVFTSIGGAPIVAAAGTFLLLNRGLRQARVEIEGVQTAAKAGFLIRLGTSFGGLRLRVAEAASAIAIARGEFGSFRGLLRSTGSSLASLVPTTTAVTIGVAALAGAVFFLATRDSLLERAQKSLARSTNELAKSYGSLHAAQQAQLSAEQTVRSDEQTVANARQAASTAEAVRQSLSAGASATQRKAAEDRLKITLQDLDGAERQLAIDRQALADANRVLANEADKNKQKREDELNDIKDLQRELEKRARFTSTFGGRGRVQQNRLSAAQEEKAAVDQLTDSLLKNAKALRDLDNASGADINLAERFEAIARFTKQFGKANPTVLTVLLNSDNVKSGLTRLEQLLRDRGQVAQANFAHGLLTGDVDAAILQLTKTVLHPWAGTGEHAGEDFSTNLHRSLLAGAKGAADAAATLAAAVRIAFLKGVQALANQTDTLFSQLTDLEIQGASPEERLAAAKRAQARANAFRARADAALKKTPRGETEQKDVKDAQAAQQRAQSAVESIEAEMDADAKAAAAKHKEAVDKIAADRKEAEDKFIAAVTLRRGALDLALQRAQATVNDLADDIKAQEEISAQIRKDIAAARIKIKDQQRLNETVQEYQQALEASDQAIAELRVTQIKNRFALAQTKAEATETLKDDLAVNVAIGNAIRNAIAVAKKNITDSREQALVVGALTAALKVQNAATEALRKQFVVQQRDREQEKLDLDVQIAEAQGNKGKELAAHKKLLAFLIARRKHTDAGTLEYKKLTLQIEQQQAAIRELNKAQTDLNSAGASLAFSILQTQAGFASTILSNLLPKGSVAGAVGGTATGISTPTGQFIPPADFATGVHKRPPGSTGSGIRDTFGPRQPLTVGVGAEGAGGPSRPPDIRDLGTGLTRTTAGAGAPTPPTSGQLMTLIHIAKLQLQAIQKLAGQHTHPESKTSRATQPVDYGGHT